MACGRMQQHITTRFSVSAELCTTYCGVFHNHHILRFTAFLLQVINYTSKGRKCATAHSGAKQRVSAVSLPQQLPVNTLVARLPAYRITFPKFILKSKTAGAERKLFFGSTPTLIGLVLPSRVHLSMPVAYNNQCRTPFVRHKYITVRLYIELLLYIFFFF